MLKRYDIVIDGNPTTLLLSDADAAARGLVPNPEPETTTDDDAPVKARKPANKSRRPANKATKAAATKDIED